jgi:soluble lytic murein transglycosylase-like protein
MRCVMRCFRVALKLVISAVPIAAVLFVWCGPASAHAHHHYSYRHAHAHGGHYPGRHLYAMYGNDAATGGFNSQYFASPYAAQNNFSGYGSARSARYDNVSAMATSQVGTAGLPASLVERVIRRESGGNPRAVHAGNYGLMQIRLGTARAMGYTGSAAGLLDPQTNMTYALRYLAGAYRAAGGNESRAVALYSRGYYNQAKAQGFSPYSSGTSAASGWGFGSYRQGVQQPSFQASVQPAFQTGAWPAEQYGLRHRRHYRV